MRIFLLWRRDTGPGAALDPDEVARALQDVVRPLFIEPPPVTVERNAAAAMVFAHLPVRGWAAPFAQEDEHSRAYATDYPIGVPRVLAPHGALPPAPEGELPALGRRLDDDPAPVVRELPPPFALLWWPRDRDEALLQTDGLGQAQVFEYDDGALWAATNKITALRALGVRLEPDRLDWATKCTIGWFPLDRSGYANVTFAPPGARRRLTRDGVQRSTVDVLGDWVRPAPMARADALELSRTAMIRHVRDGAAHFAGRPATGLSGGWDTRAVVASFVAAGIDVRTKVKGQEGKFDVPIARRLADVAGLDLQVRPKSGMPPERTEDLERSLRLALLWQGGHMWRESHKAFLWGNERHGDGGALNVMGQHGEIARGYYEQRAGAHAGGVLDYLMAGAPAALRPDVRDAVRERLAEAFAQAECFGLTGPAALDFLYLFERTRRHNSASVNSQFGFVFTPFLAPDVIRAAYALRAAGEPFVRDGRQLNPLHRHVIETNMPQWRDVEFESDLEAAAAADGADAGPRDWRLAQGRRYYDYAGYWRDVGRPLADRLTSRDGLWTEIFDPDAVRAAGEPAPLDLVLVALMAETLETARV